MRAARAGRHEGRLLSAPTRIAACLCGRQPAACRRLPCPACPGCLRSRPCLLLTRSTRPSPLMCRAGPWSASEDAQLVELVGQYGGKHWARIASMLPGRTGKQCRERWCNNLDPSLKKGAWTPEEDETILAMHAKLGTRCAAGTARLVRPLQPLSDVSGEVWRVVIVMGAAGQRRCLPVARRLVSLLAGGAAACPCARS